MNEEKTPELLIKKILMVLLLTKSLSGS
jgi:hypothetical protein